MGVPHHIGNFSETLVEEIWTKDNEGPKQVVGEDMNEYTETTEGPDNSLAEHSGCTVLDTSIGAPFTSLNSAKEEEQVISRSVNTIPRPRRSVFSRKDSLTLAQSPKKVTSAPLKKPDTDDNEDGNENDSSKPAQTTTASRCSTLLHRQDSIVVRKSPSAKAKKRAAATKVDLLEAPILLMFEDEDDNDYNEPPAKTKSLTKVKFAEELQDKSSHVHTHPLALADDPLFLEDFFAECFYSRNEYMTFRKETTDLVASLADSESQTETRTRKVLKSVYAACRSVKQETHLAQDFLSGHDKKGLALCLDKSDGWLGLELMAVPLLRDENYLIRKQAFKVVMAIQLKLQYAMSADARAESIRQGLEAISRPGALFARAVGQAVAKVVVKEREQREKNKARRPKKNDLSPNPLGHMVESQHTANRQTASTTQNEAKEGVMAVPKKAKGLGSKEMEENSSEQDTESEDVEEAVAVEVEALLDKQHEQGKCGRKVSFLTGNKGQVVSAPANDGFDGQCWYSRQEIEVLGNRNETDIDDLKRNDIDAESNYRGTVTGLYLACCSAERGAFKSKTSFLPQEARDALQKCMTETCGEHFGLETQALDGIREDMNKRKQFHLQRVLEIQNVLLSQPYPPESRGKVIRRGVETISFPCRLFAREMALAMAPDDTTKAKKSSSRNSKVSKGERSNRKTSSKNESKHHMLSDSPKKRSESPDKLSRNEPKCMLNTSSPSKRRSKFPKKLSKKGVSKRELLEKGEPKGRSQSECKRLSNSSERKSESRQRMSLDKESSHKKSSNWKQRSSWNLDPYAEANIPLAWRNSGNSNIPEPAWVSSRHSSADRGASSSADRNRTPSKRSSSCRRMSLDSSGHSLESASGHGRTPICGRASMSSADSGPSLGPGSGRCSLDCGQHDKKRSSRRVSTSSAESDHTLESGSGQSFMDPGSSQHGKKRSSRCASTSSAESKHSLESRSGHHFAPDALSSGRSSVRWLSRRSSTGSAASRSSSASRATSLRSASDHTPISRRALARGSLDTASEHAQGTKSLSRWTLANIRGPGKT